MTQGVVIVSLVVVNLAFIWAMTERHNVNVWKQKCRECWRENEDYLGQLEELQRRLKLTSWPAITNQDELRRLNGDAEVSKSPSRREIRSMVQELKGWIDG